MFREDFPLFVLNKCYFQIITPHLNMYFIFSWTDPTLTSESRSGKTQQYVFQKLNHKNQVSCMKHTKMLSLAFAK